MKSCNNCTNALMADYGYSNYTVEGTEFHCTLKKHPLGSFDRFYGKDERLGFAENCTSFSEGYPEGLDVECEVLEDLPEQHKSYWKE